MAPLDILGLSALQLQDEARRRLSSGYGVWQKIYRDAMRGHFAPETYGLSAASVLGWQQSFNVGLLKVVRTVEEPSALGPTTVKAVLATHDGYEIECVRIPMAQERFTLCVSSQVGCKLACAFCETGKMGLLRHLTAAEIVGQLVTVQHALGWQIRNVVFMGMGEPLDNPDHLLQALRILNDRRGLSIGQDRITVCTAGRPDGLARLAELGWERMGLSLSLNAATDAKRERLMPVTKKYPLATVTEALLAFPRRTKFVFAVNYCLLPGLNDTRQDAAEVAQFCRPLGRALVNVIPYNPGSVPLTRAPTEIEVNQFIDWLREEGLPVQRRITKGQSVMAACGQLGNLELKRKRLPLVGP